jgi:hypothetical protein
MIAHHGSGSPTRNGRHRQLQNGDDLRSPVDQVSDENEPSPSRMSDQVLSLARTIPLLRNLVTEVLEELDQLVETAVHIAHDIEGSTPPSSIARQRSTNNDCGGSLLRTPQPVTALERLLDQRCPILLQLSELPLDDTSSHLSARPLLIVCEIRFQRVIEDDRHAGHVVTTSQFDQWQTGIATGIRRIDHRKTATPEPPFRDPMQELESFTRRTLICLVVRDHSTEEIRGKHLCRPEMALSEG